LPGTTGSNVATRPSQTERAATLTLAELEKWITIEICEKYHQKIHSSLQTTPLSAWRDSFARDQKAPPVVDDAQMFLLHFLPVERRRLQREGIKLFNIRYWDNILPSIARRGDELLIRYDPRNLSRIYVLATGHHYHIVPYADVRKPPITLWEHAWATKFLRARGERNLDETRIFRAVLEQRRLVEQSSAATKSARRSKQRRKEAQRPSLPVSTPATTAIDYSSPPDEYPAEVWEPRHDR
jgi:putative transposase